MAFAASSMAVPIALFEGVRRGLKRGLRSQVDGDHVIALFEGVRRGLKRRVVRRHGVGRRHRLIRGSKAWIETSP